MAKLPTATSQATLTSKSPGVKVDASEFGRTGKAISKIGEAVSQSAKKFKDLQNLQEYTSASTDAKRKMAELEVQAQNDEDIYTMDERYGRELQKIKDDALNQISDRETQLRFGAELDNLARTKEFNIRSISRTKQVDRSKASLLNDLDQSKRDFYNAGSGLERQQLQDSVMARLDNFASLGVIKKEKAFELGKAWKDEVRLGQVMHDAALNPEMAKDNIEKGVYKLSPEEKEEALNDVADLIKKRKTRQEVALFRGFNKNETDIANAIIDGQMSVADLDQLELLGAIGDSRGISKDFATVARRAIKSDKAEDPTVDVDSYNDILDDFVALKVDKKKKRTKASLEDLMRFRVKVMNKYADGDITSAQMSRFLQDVSQVYSDKLDEKTKENVDLADPTPWYKVYRWTDEYANKVKESRTRIAEKMMEKIEGGMPSSQAADEAIEEEKGQNNPLFNLFKDAKPGDIVDTPAGPVRFIKTAPDGEPMIEAVQ